MSDRSFFEELKHRKVYRAAAIYAGAAFVLWQVADIALPALGAPYWVMRLLVIGAIAGFPVAVVLAWLIDLAPGGARRLRLAFGGLAALVVLGGAAALVARVGLPDAEPDISERTLAVLPFHVRGSELGYLRDGLVDLLSRNLGGADLHPVDASIVVKAAEREGDAALSARDGAEVARRVGAGHYVLGTVNQVGATIRIHATLYALRDSVHALVSGEEEGDTLQLFDMVDRLTATLLAGRSTGQASRRGMRTAATTTSSLPALKLYLEGERHFRVGEHDSAVARFGEALEQDSTFALARFRRAMSHSLNNAHGAARADVERLVGEAARLSEHDRRVLQAFAAHAHGRRAEAERLYRVVVRDYPADVEAKVMLASLITTYALVRGTPLAEAKSLLDDIEALDPEFLCISCMQQSIALQERDYDRLVELQRRLRAGQGQDTTRDPLREAFAAMRAGNLAGVDSAVAVADSMLDDAAFRNMLGGSMLLAAITTGHMDAAQRLLDAARARELPERMVGMRAYQLALATGRLRDAAAEIAQLNAGGTPLPERMEVGAVVGHASLRLGGLDALRERLRAWQPSTVSDTGEPDPTRAVPRLFYLGLIDARREDPAAAQWADSLDAALRGVSRQDSVIVAGMARTLRADHAWRAGEPEAALRLLDGVSTDLPPDILSSLGDHVFYAADLRARAYLDAGRFEDALRWFRYSIDGLMPVANYGFWHLGIARALDGLGRREEAADHYARVVEAWAQADPELAPQVEYARRRLTAIRIE